MNYLMTANRTIQKYTQNASVYVRDMQPSSYGVVSALGDIINLLTQLDSDTWETKTSWSLPSILESYSDAQTNSMDMISGDFEVACEINRFPKKVMFHLEPTSKDNFKQGIINKLGILNVGAVAQLKNIYIVQANMIASPAITSTLNDANSATTLDSVNSSIKN